MSTQHPLQDYQGRLRSRMGACFPGERTVFRGRDLHAHLQDIDWVELYAFGITGRRFSAPQLKLLHALWSTTSYPDARLWNNRVAALAGSARSTASLAIGAAIAVSEAGIYGWQPVIAIADFLLRARRRLAAGEQLQEVLQQELRQHRRIGGYGRPVATLKVDERIAAIRALMERERLEEGPCLQLAFAIEQGLLQAGRNLPINYAPVLAAVLLDLGFSLRECHLFVQPCLMAGMPPCYLEALERPEGATFAISCANVQYEGPARRRW